MDFLKTTLLGGIVFLMPFAFVMLVLGKVLKWTAAVAEPLTRWIGSDSIAGVARADFVAAAAIVGLCFVAGLVAKRPRTGRVRRRLEAGFLTSVPGYGVIKGLTEGLAGVQDPDTMKPVLARFDDAAQVAFEMGRASDGRVVLYVPGAPDPWSGGLLVMAADRVEPLDITLPAALRSFRALGRGSEELLRSRTSRDTA